MARSVLQAEIKKRLPFEHIEQEVLLNLFRTCDQMGIPFERLLKARGISEPLYNVLRILRGEGKALPCLEVASRMITRLPDITRLVDRLGQKGLVERSRTEEDRRVVLISITPKGLALLAEIDPLEVDLHKTLLSHMSPIELAELNRLLVKARRPETSGCSANVAS